MKTNISEQKTVSGRRKPAAPQLLKELSEERLQLISGGLDTPILVVSNNPVTMRREGLGDDLIWELEGGIVIE